MQSDLSGVTSKNRATKSSGGGGGDCNGSDRSGRRITKCFRQARCNKLDLTI